MRHRKHRGQLGRPSGHRRALLANLAAAVITHGRIETTEAKARAVRPYLEKLITLGKRGDLHARRQALAKLRHRAVVDRLFNEVAKNYADRPGGYTRLIKTGFRVGDAAPMAVIELVQEPCTPKAKKAAKKPAEKPEAKPQAEAEPEEQPAEQASAADESGAEPAEAEAKAEAAESGAEAAGEGEEQDAEKS